MNALQLIGGSCLLLAVYQLWIGAPWNEDSGEHWKRGALFLIAAGIFLKDS